MKSEPTPTPASQLETSYSRRHIFDHIISEWFGIPKPKPKSTEDAEPKRDDEVRKKEILLQQGLKAHEYNSTMRRRCHDAWNNEVITSRGLRDNYFWWIKRVFGMQLVVANLIVFICAFTGHVAPAIIAGSLAGLTGLVATVTKYLFSAESTRTANDLIKVVSGERNETQE